MIKRKIVLVRTGSPSNNINAELQWFGQSLGLFGPRDRDKSAFRLFLELLKAAKAQESMSSDELANRLLITRATVVYHLNELMERGLVVQQRKRYLLRENELQRLMDDLQRDVEATLHHMRDVAKEIDERL
ncbi:hypothetical protein CMO91_01860 [Candidatus Woesearchaeota archaeon]|nr:hypothetical protein [Candidatus Woesearchaeota archaeon]|tara:strand:+ start:719 stop:1111 length:393 start_codon:yes stop_codon:yes gene_type:complete